MRKSLGMRAVMSPLLCAMLSALLWPRTAISALPPPVAAGSSAQPAGSLKAPAEDDGGALWAIPVAVRFGGILSYDMRRSMDEGRTTRQQNVMSTLRASANTFIWEPWFAQLNGSLSATAMRSSAESSAADVQGGATKGLVLTGAGQLNLLPGTRFPFEAHFEKSDSRISNELVAVEAYSSQRFGFTQQFLRRNGNIAFGWDRTTLDAERNGRDQQDSLQLNASQNVDKHRFSLNGRRGRNTRARTGEAAIQDNLTLQHSYSPAPVVSFENMANISRSGFKLLGSESHTDLAQLSTLAFWRPSDRPLTVSTGARILAMEAESSSIANSVPGTRLRNANANLGLTYDLSQTLHFTGAANVNMNETNGNRDVGTNQAAGLNYRPASQKIGEFNYNWGAGINVSNSSGFDGQRTTQAGANLNQSLGRSVNLGEGSWLYFDVSQSFSTTKMFEGPDDAQDYSRQITHSASASWAHSREGRSSMVRLSMSDSRALEGDENYFQLINLQASSNLPTSGYSSWNGSLTLQATRQGRKSFRATTQAINGDSGIVFDDQGKFVTTSSGAVSYQNSRLFGVRRLNFVSELRLNSNALLPLFNGPQDQEMAAWENRLDYFIGRTQLRLNTMLSRISESSGVPVNGLESPRSGSKISKAIMFSVSRSFGDL